jgi:hypothetical protein
LGIITTVCLLASGISLINSDAMPMGWYIILIVIPALIAWINTLNRKFTIEHYHAASTRLKIIMVLGLCSLIVNILLSLRSTF